MNLSACIVVYNGYDEVLKAAQTVLQFTRRYPLTLYLVDNASPDGSGPRLEQALPQRERRLWHRPQHRPAGACQHLPLHPQPGYPAHGRYPQ